VSPAGVGSAGQALRPCGSSTAGRALEGTNKKAKCKSQKAKVKSSRPQMPCEESKKFVPCHEEQIKTHRTKVNAAWFFTFDFCALTLDLMF
jgi:hypothetical protein